MHHSEWKESVEKHDQPALDRRHDRLHESTHKIDDTTTQETHQCAGRSTKPLGRSLEETCSALLFASSSTTTLGHKPLTGALRLIAVVKPRRSRKQSKRQHIVGLRIRQSASVCR